MKRILIIAPSSPVGRHELFASAAFLKKQGFDVTIDPQCFLSSGFFAGTDEQRAQALVRAAQDKEHDIIWCARGGYGAFRAISALPKRVFAVPKMLVGYSDATALLHYASLKWGFSCLHAPMPGILSFSALGKSYWTRLASYLHTQDPSVLRVQNKKLVFWTKPQAIRAKLIGGNLTVLHSLLGTSDAPCAKGRLVFLEDTDESLYRIDRMVFQMKSMGFFKGASGIILGNFLRCQDSSARVLKKPLDISSKKKIEKISSEGFCPLRSVVSLQKGLKQIFSDLGVPVLAGFPAGHGPQMEPFPLFGSVQILASGAFQIL
jgi:muramoyltetrapeptide carboxypeptidase